MNRRWSPSSSRIPAVERLRRAPSRQPRRSMLSTRSAVGSATAATTRATSSAPPTRGCRGAHPGARRAWTGIGRGSPGAGALPRRCRRFGQLEREERIPAGRLPEPEQRRPREGHVEPPVEQLAQGADAYSDDLERRQPPRARSAGASRADRAAHRQEHGERLSPRRENAKPERCERSRVEPLEVVDCKADRGRRRRAVAAPRGTPRDTARSSTSASGSPSSNAASSARRWIGGSSRQDVVRRHRREDRPARRTRIGSRPRRGGSTRTR